MLQSLLGFEASCSAMLHYIHMQLSTRHATHLTRAVLANMHPPTLYPCTYTCRFQGKDSAYIYIKPPLDPHIKGHDPSPEDSAHSSSFMRFMRVTSILHILPKRAACKTLVFSNQYLCSIGWQTKILLQQFCWPFPGLDCNIRDQQLRCEHMALDKSTSKKRNTSRYELISTHHNNSVLAVCMMVLRTGWALNSGTEL